MVVLDLPENLVEEILCRVPATSLKRLRSTCKRWDNLFNDKRFTRKHLNTAAKQFLVLMLTKEFSVCPMSVNLLIDELKLKGSHSNSARSHISRVFHCDGLLLCTFKDNTRIVVWNPWTGQTKWIQKSYKRHKNYTLGSYQDNKSGSNSYKILCYGVFCEDPDEFEIYEINSNTWRTLEVTPTFNIVYTKPGVSLRGKTYWFAVDKVQRHLGIFLVSFDYTTEKFGRLCLPYNCTGYKTMALSVDREEKLSVLLQQGITSNSKTEIWVTYMIDETKEVSWSKVLTLDFNYPNKAGFWINSSFMVVEKKLVVCCEVYNSDSMNNTNKMVDIVGEDNSVTQVNFGESTLGSFWPVILNYFPTLVQI